MFWKKQGTGAAALPGPKEIPELVGRYLVVEKKRDPDWVWKLKGVVRPNPSKGKKSFDIRVFDDAAVATAGVKVKDYTSFDDHPEMVLFEGWFDKDSLKVVVEEVSKVKP